MTNWKDKRSNNLEQKKKGFSPNHNFWNNNTHNFPNKNFQGNKGNSHSNPNGPRKKNLLIIIATTLRIMNVMNQ